MWRPEGQELASFAALEVHSKPMTMAAVRKAGYKQRPVRSHIIFSCKTDIVTGTFLMPKARWVVDGTPAQMALFEHYVHSYSPAPNPVATRMMQAAACGLGKRRHAGDIKTAFLHSRLTPSEMVPIRLPATMESTIDGTVCEFVIAQRGQYGMPSASYYWTRELRTWLLKTFNSSTYSIVNLILEPCMYIITNIVTGAITHMLVHVDDVDVIADSDDDVAVLFAAIDSEFGLVYGNPDVMLGVHRQMSEKSGVRYLEFTMTEYVSDLHAQWVQTMSDRGTPISDRYAPAIPFPELTQLSVLGTDTHPLPRAADTAATVTLYRQLVGGLLWLSRMCMPDLLFSCSMESRVLAVAGEAHLKLAMQTLRYAYD